MPDSKPEILDESELEAVTGGFQKPAATAKKKKQMTNEKTAKTPLSKAPVAPKMSDPIGKTKNDKTAKSPLEKKKL